MKLWLIADDDQKEIQFFFNFLERIFEIEEITPEKVLSNVSMLMIIL
jgi:hypothetical protein